MTDHFSAGSCELPGHFYHGTTELYLGSMLAKGILPCTCTGAVKMTCLADEIAIARHHAFHMREFDGTPEVVFRIPIARFDPALFVLEDNFVRLAPSSGRGVAEYAKVGSTVWKGRGWTWQGMLRLCGVVGYTVSIPVTLDDVMATARKPEPA